MSSLREKLERVGGLGVYSVEGKFALYDWMVAVTAELEAKGCPCGNVRNRADNSRAFCPHCNGIDAKGQS